MIELVSRKGDEVSNKLETKYEFALVRSNRKGKSWIVLFVE